VFTSKIQSLSWWGLFLKNKIDKRKFRVNTSVDFNENAHNHIVVQPIKIRGSFQPLLVGKWLLYMLISHPSPDLHFFQHHLAFIHLLLYFLTDFSVSCIPYDDT
jgi:hypothetical protein